MLTATRHRLSTLSGGLYLNELIQGCETRGRPTDLFYAVRVEDGTVGAAKIFYQPLVYEEPNLASAEFEWSVSGRLDAAAVGPLQPFRVHVARYSDKVDLGNNRTALFMPAYTRSFQSIVWESPMAVTLPAPFLLRTARDVLRGLVLLHSVELAHCDVKGDNIMYASNGSATLIDLGAVTEFGKPMKEGIPPVMAMGISLEVGRAEVDLVGLASTLWLALYHVYPTIDTTPQAFAQRAKESAATDASPASRVLQAVSRILLAVNAADALEAVEAIMAAA